MYGMTAAHPTLPIPSYVRVTNISNRRSVVVRVNDRGPFLSERLIDLSYTAAYKLDVLGGGSAWVEVETILPGGGATLAVAAALAPVSNSDSTSNSSKASTATRSPSRIALAVVEGSPPLARPEEQQSDEANPDLFEIIPSQAQYGTSDSMAMPIPVVAHRIPQTRVEFTCNWALSVPMIMRIIFLCACAPSFPSISSLGIMAKDGLFKVHAGPYPDQNVARQDADKIAQSLSIRPMLLIR